ncbi:MAG TPA: multiheme c-type cytochrome [Terracidiphilus sp.]|nr:multiheme c-type cytochrome [Terracidiphilus sp.]
MSNIHAVLSIIKWGPRRMFRAKVVFLPVLAASLILRPAVALHSSKDTQSTTDRTDYSGDASCQKCHRDIGENYHLTPHHLTSQLPTSSSVHGSFQNGANSLIIVDTKESAEPGLQFLMESKKDGLFETARSGWDSDVYQRTERIDLITGSGVRGQTYLYWQGDRLFELPVSYWSDSHRWINSPGYVDGTADFSRPVNPACLECHATYIRTLSANPATNRYDRKSLVPGISCESCHGPGANHVRQELRQETKAKEPSILNPANFSRDLQVDLCAECHNGIQREALAPAFSYIPGRPLSEYFKPLPSPAGEHPDVHGNQVGLLQRSKCYRSSAKMSCSTCHDVHTTRQSAESYSLKCLSCHNWQSCGMSKKMGHRIMNKCIDCHMPIEETNVIVSQTAGQVVHARMRNHWIKVYADVRLPESSRSAARP